MGSGSATAAVAANPVWYHTLELGNGVVTPGRIDLRETAAKLLPDDLTGKRALDVGTFDGFWAFELERRGAEVVATDVEEVDHADWPPLHRDQLVADSQATGLELGRGFAIAHDALGSSVRRVVCNVYDLSPEVVGGPVDVAFIGALLIHLRDPVRALERVRETLVPGGELYQLESFDLRTTITSPRRPVARLRTLDSHFDWWLPNRSALRAWVRTAGFEDVRGCGFHHPPQQKPMNDRLYGLVSRAPAA